ncbi:MAG: class I SAM-dependent methyltransferase [Gammaproteobacteria bacterium]|nr:class I SAM-dependent methyltransferase [Gammaproteobacteria bacterium]
MKRQGWTSISISTEDSQDCRCPLCQSAAISPFFQDRRHYLRCATCQLVFVPPSDYLTPKQERAEYDLHENSVDDPGYRQFLSRLFFPVSNCLEPDSEGLDFGSGPEPLLSQMFVEAGHSMQIYDHFYAPDESPLQQQYDFITASEVVEHLHHPREALERLWSCLRPNGVLGIMTKRVLDLEAFSNWHYKNDPTHVSFFSIESFEWLASHWGARLAIPEKDVVILTKRGAI